MARWVQPLSCQHPLSEHLPPRLISLLAIAPGEAADGPGPWVPATQLRDLNAVPGFSCVVDPTCCGQWGVSQTVEDSLSLSLSVSLFSHCHSGLQVNTSFTKIVAISGFFFKGIMQTYIMRQQ